jgi:hypothetical protein
MFHQFELIIVIGLNINYFRNNGESHSLRKIAQVDVKHLPVAVHKNFCVIFLFYLL